MSASKLVRWGALGALLAAVAWTASGIIALVLVEPPATNMGPVGSPSWYLIESGDAMAEVGMMGAVVGLHARQTPSYGRLGMVGSIVAFFGAAFAALSTVLWLLTLNGDGIVGLLFSLGGLGALVGFPVLGVATLRAAVLPRWCGLLLVGWLVYFPLIFLLLDLYGEARALFGLVFLALGYALWPQSGLAGQQSSRALEADGTGGRRLRCALRAVRGARAGSEHRRDRAQGCWRSGRVTRDSRSGGGY